MENALNTYGLLFGVVITVLAAGASFFNRQRYEAQITLLQSGNDELRSQNKDLRDERTDLTGQVAAYKARNEEKDRRIDELKKQPKLRDLIKLINQNHTEVMKALGRK